jgi:uncharacterized protein (UPF0335 family)
MFNLFTKELLDTVRKLSALEARTEDVLKEIHRVGERLDNMIDRLSKLEADHAYLKENVRNEIMADIKSELVRTQMVLDLHKASSPDSLANVG